MPTDQQELQPTSPSQWGRANQTIDTSVVVELPSGNVARVRRTMSIFRIVQEGSIPNPLRGIVLDMVRNGNPAAFEKADNDPVVMRQFADFLDTVAVETMVEPTVDMPVQKGKLKDEAGDFINPDETEDEYFARCEVWSPSEGSVSVFDIEAEDKIFLFVMSQGGVADAKTFREVISNSVDSVEDVAELPRKTKRTGGDGKRAGKK